MRTAAAIILAMAIVILTPFVMFWQAVGTEEFVSILLHGMPR